MTGPIQTQDLWPSSDKSVKLLAIEADDLRAFIQIQFSMSGGNTKHANNFEFDLNTGAEIS